MCSSELKIGLLILLSLGVLFYALILLYKNKTRENYYLFGFAALLFTIIYLITVLDYKISGTALGVEKTIQEINTSKEEIKKIANTMVKMSYVLADGTGRWDGMPKEHLEQIKKYRESIKEYLDPNLDQDIQKTISQLNEQIKKRTENK